MRPAAVYGYSKWIMPQADLKFRRRGHDGNFYTMAAFELHDGDEIHSLLAETGFKKIEMITRRLDLRLPTLADFIPNHISATPMASGYNAASIVAQKRVIQEVTKRLAQYRYGKDVTIPFTMRLVTALR